MLFAVTGFALTEQASVTSLCPVETIAASKGNGAERNRTAVRTGVDHLVRTNGPIHSGITCDSCTSLTHECGLAENNGC